jgi:hypothetical protein
VKVTRLVASPVFNLLCFASRFSFANIDIEMSESSRLGDVVEIGDLSGDDAVRYLTDRKVPENIASQVVEITGGRMNLLKFTRSEVLEKNKSIEGPTFSFLFVRLYF